MKSRNWNQHTSTERSDKAMIMEQSDDRKSDDVPAILVNHTLSEMTGKAMIIHVDFAMKTGCYYP